MCGFLLQRSVYSMVGVWSTLHVQKRNASFIVKTLNSELHMAIHIIYMVEQDFHLVFLVMQITSSTYPFHHGVGMGYCGPSASSLKYIPCKYLLGLVRLRNPLLLPEVACKICVGRRTHSCSKHVPEEIYFVFRNVVGMFQERLVVFL